jgi:hypothetical protein
LGSAIPGNRLGNNTVALDSWLSLGAATDSHLGVLKSEDTDGSVIGGSNHSDGLLANDHTAVGIPLTTADGLISGELSLDIVTQDIDLTTNLGNTNSSTSLNTNGAVSLIYVAGGIQGPTESNRVLIGQITTDGEFCFELNLQIREVIGTDGKYDDDDAQHYAAHKEIVDDIEFEALNYCAVPGCTDPLALNYNDLATVDNGTCTYAVNVLGNINLKPGLSVYPVPADNEIILSIINVTEKGDYKYNITNIIGKEILQGKFEVNNARHNENIDISGLPKRIYIIHIESDNNCRYHEQIIKN